MEYLVMSWYWKLLLLLLAFFTEVGAGQNQWRESRCGDKGPIIRFPFQLKDTDHHQPMSQRGYPGFELSCNGSNTVLELPGSVKFFIENINYESQVIEVYDPENCLVKQLLKLESILKSPFRFQEDYFSYTLFNCSKERDDDQMDYYYSPVPCLNGLSYSIYFLLSDSTIDYISPYCKKMYNTSPLPIDKYDVTGYKDGRNLGLSWSKPSCGHCEAKGKMCRWKDNSTFDTECFNPKPSDPNPSKGQSTKFVAIGGTLGGAVLVAVLVLAYRAYSSNKQEKENQMRIERFLDDYRALKPSRYSYADIKHITCQFKEKLGEGAVGTVFKGKLSDDFFVAVKLLNSSKGDGEEFVNEVGTIGRIHHINVVRLVGYCADGFIRALVYEFLPNGSLQRFISSSDSKHFLGWKNLQDIALGIAKGIEYLHQGCDQRILHFDIKPHNVLLDQDFTPKIADFGLAKLCSKDQSLVSMTTARGTMGYIAPEVFSRNFGKVSYKSDVYSFGMVLLEMVGGRKITDVAEDNTSQIYYPEWIYNLLEEGDDLRIHIGEEGDAIIAKKLAIVGLWCIQWHPVDRPSMKAVVHMLEGGETLTMPPNPFISAHSTKKVDSKPKRRMNLELEAVAEID